MAYQTINPFTNKVVKTYENHDDAYVEDALTKAHALYKKWRNEPIEDRAKILHQVSQYFTDHTDELARVLVEDMGKLFTEAQGEVAICAAIAEYYATQGERFLEKQPIETVMGYAHVENHSMGVVMAVEPWNFPFYQMMRVFAPNFLVGNPLLYKHASNTPGSAVAFEAAVREAGAPEGSCVNLFINYDQVNKIIADMRVQGVALTGSERAGKEIAAEAGRNLKKSSLELGGSDPFIILDDTNLDEVNKIIGQARLYNAGQVCTSSKRFIVTEKNYDKVLQMMKDAFAKAKVGDPLDSNTTLAPLSTNKAKAGLLEKVHAALDDGATLAFGELNENMDNNFFEPIILTDIDRDNSAYWTEFFGPVGQIYKVKDEQAAIDLANDSNYGLGGIVFGGDPNHAAEVAGKVETGMVFVNNFGGTVPELPFGGIKNSGYGRELGKLGIETFVNPEMVMVNEKDYVDMDNTFGGFV